MRLPKHEKYPEPKEANPWHHEEKWLEIERSFWERLGDACRQTLIQRVKTYARSKIAYQVLQQLKPIADRLLSRDVQAAIKVVITIAGAFTYGTGMRVITSPLGVFALPAGLIGGAIASFIVDRLAVEANTNRLKQEQARGRIHRLERQLQEVNPQRKPLWIEFYRAQRQLVHEVEGPALQRSFPRNAVFAMILSVMEYAVALWIVQNMGILAMIPLGLRLALAGLPVFITHAAALAEAIAFEMPQYARELIRMYRNRLVPHPSLSPTDVDQWRLEQALVNGGLTARMTNLFDCHPMEPTPPLAQLAFEREFFTDGIEQLGAQKVTAERDLWNAYEQAVKALPAQCPIPEPDLTGRTELEIVRKQRQVAQDRLRWVEEKTALLRQETEQKVEQLRKDYQAATGLWQTALGQVEERYNQQYTTWKREEQRWQAETEMGDSGDFGDMNIAVSFPVSLS